VLICLAYRLYTVLPQLRQMIENLTNWYIHCNRKRLKGTPGLGDDDNVAAVNTLFEVLLTLVRALAPFMPFLTEHIYQLLRPYIPSSFTDGFKDSRSVHFLPFPEANNALFDADVERRVAFMQRVVELGRTARERCGVGRKTPLQELVIVADSNKLEDLETLAVYIKENLNVRELQLSSEEDRFGVRLRAVPDWQRLGKQYKKAAQSLKAVLPNLTNSELRQFLKSGSMEVNGMLLGAEDLSVVRGFAPSENLDGDLSKYEANFDRDFVILLDRTANQELVREGIAREIIKQMNLLRKSAGLIPTDEVKMWLSVLADPDGMDLAMVVATHRDMIENALRGPLEISHGCSDELKSGMLTEDTHEMAGLEFWLGVTRA
jgi:isoleucyl-tRNA synthetase